MKDGFWYGVAAGIGLGAFVYSVKNPEIPDQWFGLIASLVALIGGLICGSRFFPKS